MRVIPRPSPNAATKGLLSDKTRSRITPYLFILPYVIIFVTFRLGTSLVGLGISFTNWSAIGTPQWVGLKNYIALAHDTRLLEAFKNTIFFTGLTVPLLIILSLALAVFMNQPYRGRALGRVAVFVPYVIMSTVVGVVWTWLLNKDFGLINVYLGLKIPWLVSSNYAIYGIIITTVWWTVGYDMIIFLAGLQDIPGDLKEAARIDGANGLQIFRYVTWPLLAPTTFVVLLLTIINSFQIFDQVYVMTSGGPGTSTLTLVQYIYIVGFQNYKFGYGSAIAVVLFIILMAAAIIQTRAYRTGMKGAQ